MLRSLTRIATGNLLVFALADMLGNFGRSLVFPYASLYILALGGDAAKIGIIAFVSQLASLVLLPVAGHITDHADRIRLIVLSGLLSSGFLLITIFAPTWHVVAAAGLLSGMVVFQFPAYASLIADSLNPANRGQGIGVLNTISSSIAVFAPYLAGLCIERYTTNLGMRILYGSMLVLNLAGILIQMRFLKEPSPVPRQPLHLDALFQALKQAYRSIPGLVRHMPRSLAALTGVVMLSFITNGLTGPYWVVYAVEEVGLSAREWGLIMLVEAVLRLGMFLPAGMLVDRWGRTTSLVAALAISALASPLFVVVKGMWAILAVRAVLAVAFTLAIPACTALMADLVPRLLRGQLMAALGQGGIMLGAVGGAGGPALGYLIIPPMMLASLAGGYIYTFNPALPWLLSAAAGFLGVILAVLFIRDPQEAEV